MTDEVMLKDQQSLPQSILANIFAKWEESSEDSWLEGPVAIDDQKDLRE